MCYLDTVQPDVSSWTVPSLALVRGTVLGATDFTVYYPFKMQRFEVRGEQMIPMPSERWRTRRKNAPPGSLPRGLQSKLSGSRTTVQASLRDRSPVSLGSSQSIGLKVFQ